MLTKLNKDRFSYLRRIMVLPVSGLVFCSFAFALNGEPTAIPVSPGNSILINMPGQQNTERALKAQTPAEFPGGERALMTYLHKNVRYPKAAQDKNIQGMVKVIFTVDKTGKLQDVTLSSSAPRLGGGLEEEALRVVTAMPNWKPAKENGQPVSSQMELPIAFVLQEAKQQPNEVFTAVENPPTFVGGEDALNKFLSSNIKYPRAAQEKGVTGTVFVQFIVGADGKIRDVKTKGAPLGAGLEEESIRVVKAMPRWNPGVQHGHKVAVQYNLPIKYSLSM